MDLYRIALVEDHEDTREMLTILLRDCYEVEGFASGSSFLERLSTHSFDLALMDIRLPDLDGVDVLQRARAVQSDLQVIACTGLSGAAVHASLLASGFTATLLKPTDFGELSTLLETLLPSANSARRFAA